MKVQGREEVLNVMMEAFAQGMRRGFAIAAELRCRGVSDPIFRWQ